MAEAGQQGGGARIAFPGDSYAEIMLLQQYKGLNTKADRAAIDDQQFSWLENYQPIGPGNLRTLWAEAATLYTAPQTIINMPTFNIGPVQYMAVFMSDGSAVQVRLSNGATVSMGGAGKFYTGNNIPQIAQWANNGILIVAGDITNGYFAWDEVAGGTIYNPGSAGPTWIKSGASTMPNGITGTGIEIFQGRVWITNGPNTFFSAPLDGTLFSGAGGVFASQDPFVRNVYTNVKQANGFLYLFGDSSVNVISNVQTNAGVTTFTNQNVDPQVGTPFFGSVVAFGRGLMFVNSAGVFAMYGGDAQKVSDDLDGLFATANFTTAPTITCGVVTLNGVRCYGLLLNMIDGYTGANVRKLCMWDGRNWFIASQLNSLTLISGAEINSQMNLWGTNGTAVFELFQTPTTQLNKIFRTKLWSGPKNFIVRKQALRALMMVNNITGATVIMNAVVETEQSQAPFSYNTSIAFSGGVINFVNNAGQLIQFQNVGFSNIFFVLSSRAVLGSDANASGSIIGVTMVNPAADMQILAFALGCQDLGAVG